MNNNDIDFPSSWGNLKSQPLPDAPKDLLQFLNSTKVSKEELLKGRPVSKMFQIPQELLML